MTDSADTQPMFAVIRRRYGRWQTDHLVNDVRAAAFLWHRGNAGGATLNERIDATVTRIKERGYDRDAYTTVKAVEAPVGTKPY